MSPPTLAQRIEAIDSALSGLPHAFGGALALAYYAEPRSTIDIDVNVFIPAAQFSEVALPLVELGAAADDPAVADLVRRDGQARVMWDDTPIDLFFSYDAFHDAAGRDRRRVPFADTTIPILGPDHLVVCKVVFDRPKDWVDIDAMVAAGTTIDAAEVLRWVGRIAGDDDPRYDRVAALLTRVLPGDAQGAPFGGPLPLRPRWPEQRPRGPWFSIGPVRVERKPRSPTCPGARIPEETHDHHRRDHPARPPLRYVRPGRQ